MLRAFLYKREGTLISELPFPLKVELFPCKDEDKGQTTSKALSLLYRRVSIITMLLFPFMCFTALPSFDYECRGVKRSCRRM